MGHRTLREEQYVFEHVTAEVKESVSRRSHKRWVIATMVLAGGLVAAACGSSTPSAAKKTTSGNSSKNKSGSKTTTTTTAPAVTTTTVAGATTTTLAAGTTTPTTAKTTTPTTAKTTTPTTAAAGANNALGGSNDFNTPAASLTGAGSTFDQPLFARQFYDFNKSDSKVSVNYASVGSGTGESDILAGSVNFGASDVPEPSTTTGSGGAILQVPVVLGGIAMAYNEPCLGKNVHLTGTQIAQIYSGKITDWNTISSSCPTGSAIEPVYRADSSGTSNAFTHYLTSVDPTDWPASLDGKQPAFPKGEGGNGNAGVAGDVQGGSGTVGYVELAYALQSGLNYAAVENSSGAYVVPSSASVAADAAAFPNVTADNYLIVNGSGAGSYPISTYSWIIMYQKQSNSNNGIAMGKMLDWMATAGQSDAGAIGYVPLPANIQSLAISTIEKMENSSGQPLFS
jgi:phosphate transport system substrate-binding protein